MSGPWSSPVPVGSILAGKYRVERVLGVGGMGAVLAATHIDLEETRAIKLMHASESENQAAVERFLREARAAVKLRSEHVAKVHDFGRLKAGVPYIVMEYLEGCDLSWLARKEGPLPVDDVVHYLLQACDAIAEAHELGIIHRDLKPANLFLTHRDDGSPCLKVLDFGVSKHLTSGSMPDIEIDTGEDVLGSPHYMAPEQMRSSKDADARSDIWSLGAIMYRLLTGKLPFPADTTMELAVKVVETVPARPTSLRPEIPEGVEQVIMRCLERDPEARIQNATELALALVPFAPPEALERLPASRRLRSIAPPRASLGSIADGGRASWPSIPDVPRAPGVPTLSLEGAGSTWPSLPTPAPSSTTNTGVSTVRRDEDAAAPQQPARSRKALAVGAGAVILVGAAALALSLRSGRAGDDSSAATAATTTPPPAETTAAPAETTPPPAETAAPATSASAAPATSASASAAPATSASAAPPRSSAPGAPGGTSTWRPPTTSTGTSRPSSDPFGRSRK